MQDTQVRSLGWEDPLEKEMATQVLLPGKSHGSRSLVGYNPWGLNESDMTEWLHFTSLYFPYNAWVPPSIHMEPLTAPLVSCPLVFSLLYRLLTLCMITSCCCFWCQQVCQTLHYPIDCNTPDFLLTTSWSLPEYWSITSVMPSNHFILSPSSPSALNLSLHQGLFQFSWLFASGGQSIGDSASASVLSMRIQV